MGCGYWFCIVLGNVVDGAVILIAEEEYYLSLVLLAVLVDMVVPLITMLLSDSN